MQDGCKVYMDSYMASSGSCFMVTCSILKTTRPNTKPGDHGTSKPHNYWFFTFHHVWGPRWLDFVAKAFVEDTITCDFTLQTTDWYRTLQDVWSRWTWTKKLMEPELNLHYSARSYQIFHHNLHHSSCASCPASQSGDNWLIARASYVGRREPAAGVAKGGYGREGGGYNRVGFFHWWLSSSPGLDTHLFELGPKVSAPMTAPSIFKSL